MSSDVHLGGGRGGRGGRIKRKGGYEPAGSGDYEGYYESEEQWWDEQKWEENQYGGYDTGMGYYDDYESIAEMDSFEIDLYSMVFTLDESLEPQDLYVGLDCDEKSLLLVLEEGDIDEQSPAAWRSRPLKIHPEPATRASFKESSPPASSPQPKTFDIFDSVVPLSASPPSVPSLPTFPAGGAAAAQTQPPVQEVPVVVSVPAPSSPARQEPVEVASAEELPQASTPPPQPASSPRAGGQTPTATAQSPKIVISNSQLEHLKQKMQALKQRRSAQEEEPAPSPAEPAAAPPTTATAAAPVPVVAAATAVSSEATSTPAPSASAPARRLSRRATASPPRLLCPGGHALKMFWTPEPGWWCSVCKHPKPKGSAFHGCRDCDYDECEKCTKKTRAGRQTSGERTASPALARRASSPGAHKEAGEGCPREESPERETAQHESASGSASPAQQREEPRGRAGREARQAEGRQEEAPRRGLRHRREAQGATPRSTRTRRTQRSTKACASEDDGSAQERRPAREVRRAKRDPRLVPREKRPAATPEHWEPRDRREGQAEEGQLGKQERAATLQQRSPARKAGQRRRQAPTQERRAPSPATEEASGSEEPPPKKGRAANALAPPRTEETRRGAGSAASRAVSLMRASGAPPSEPSSPSAAEDVPAGAQRRQRPGPSPDASQGSTTTAAAGAEEGGVKPPRRVTETPTRPGWQGQQFVARVLRAQAKQAGKVKKATSSSAGAVTKDVEPRATLLPPAHKETAGDMSDGPSGKTGSAVATLKPPPASRAERLTRPGIRKAIVDVASQMDRKSRRV